MFLSGVFSLLFFFNIDCLAVGSALSSISSCAKVSFLFQIQSHHRYTSYLFISSTVGMTSLNIAFTYKYSLKDTENTENSINPLDFLNSIAGMDYPI